MEPIAPSGPDAGPELAPQPELAPTPAPAPPMHTMPDGQRLRIAEPLRPDLAPGDTAMVVPDRYCDKCQEARGSRRCPQCRSLTRPNDINAGEDMSVEALEEAAARVPVRFGARGGRNVRMPIDDDEGFDDDEPFEAAPAPAPRPSSRFGRGPVQLDAPRQERARAPTRAERNDRMRGNNQRNRHQDYEDDRDAGYVTTRRQKSPLDQLDALRELANVNDDHWVAMQNAWIASGVCLDEKGNPSPEMAADLADHSYAQLIERQQMANTRTRGGRRVG